MKLEQDINFLFDIDLSNFLDLVKKIQTINWTDEVFTRRDYLNLSGRSAVVFFDFIPSTMVNYGQELNTELKIFKDDCQVLIDYVLGHFENYSPVKAELSCCFPNSSQKPHVDPRLFHRYCKRIHLPLFTNANAYLEIGTNKYILEKNKVYEFNNMVSHRSVNNGKEKRIHLIIDIIKEEELKKCINKFGDKFFMRVNKEFQWQSLD